MLYQIKKRINLDTFNKLQRTNAYKQFFITDYYETFYKLKIDEFIKQGIKAEQVKAYEDIEFLDKEELDKVIISFFPSKKYFYVTSLYYNYDNRTVYYLKKLDDLIMPEKIIIKLKELSGIYYKNETEINQEIMNLITVSEFTKYSGTIEKVIKNQYRWINLLLVSFICLLFLSIIGIIIISLLKTSLKEKESKEKIEGDINSAKNDIIENPKKALPLWELANSYLQKYYNENLNQIKSIYILSLISLISGFLLILILVIMAPILKLDIEHFDIGIIAGIITEFIGATFLFIYKSTISQGLEYSNSLNKTNNIGMSIKILESIESTENNIEKIEDAKIEISKKLLSL